LNFFDQYNQEAPSEDIDWEPIFNPKDFEKAQVDFHRQDFELNESELIDYAKKVSEIRGKLLVDADKIKLIEEESNQSGQ
jgi:hypothetical protein